MYFFPSLRQSPSDYLTFHKDGKESKGIQINSILCSVTIIKSYYLIHCGYYKTSNQAASFCSCLTIVSIYPLSHCTKINSFTLSCCEAEKKAAKRKCVDEIIFIKFDISENNKTTLKI